MRMKIALQGCIPFPHFRIVPPSWVGDPVFHVEKVHWFTISCAMYMYKSGQILRPDIFNYLQVGSTSRIYK